MVGLLEDPGTQRRIVGAVRAAAARPDATRLLQQMRQGVFREFGQPIVDALGPEEAKLCVGLIHLHFNGLVMSRYILRAEPLASLPPDELTAALSPGLQRCVSGPISLY